MAVVAMLARFFCTKFDYISIGVLIFKVNIVEIKIPLMHRKA